MKELAIGLAEYEENGWEIGSKTPREGLNWSDAVCGELLRKNEQRKG